MDINRIRKYAELIVRKGANVQPGQEVILMVGLENAPLARMIVEECYKAGAERVGVDWSDDELTKLSYKYRSVDSLANLMEWEKARWEHRVEVLPVRIFIDDADPDGLAGIDQDKMKKVRMQSYPQIKGYRDQIENKYQWVIAGAPSVKWATKVFPELSAEEAVEKLWEAILYTARVTDDPIKEWDLHNEDLDKRCKYLNDLDLKELRYTADNGTNFRVGLLHGVKFEGGGEYGQLSRIFFNPNMPTEECFTSPRKGDADGIVYATKPLSYQGQLIENFWIRFENGKAVEVHAEKNQSLLENMISLDEGAAYLGECALVPVDSPVSNSGILFLNTLYDENAACHLALGMGFTNLIEGYEKMSKEEIENFGINDSMSHVDFMIGCPSLNIVGVSADGTEHQIFKDGNWAF